MDLRRRLRVQYGNGANGRSSGLMRFGKRVNVSWLLFSWKYEGF